jgi:CBS domain-containing protein
MMPLYSTPTPDLTLRAVAAGDLMSPVQVLIAETATVEDSLRALAENRTAAAPVIDAAGRPVGVVSREDLLARQRRPSAGPERMPDYYTRPELSQRPDPAVQRPGTPPPAQAAGGGSCPARPAGSQAHPVPPVTAGDVMAPLVFSVQSQTPARQVIEELVAWRIQRLLVVDREGCLIGVVHTFDLLNRLLS